MKRSKDEALPAELGVDRHGGRRQGRRREQGFPPFPPSVARAGVSSSCPDVGSGDGASGGRTSVPPAVEWDEV